MMEKFQVHQIVEKYTERLPILLGTYNNFFKNMPKIRLRVISQRFSAVWKCIQNRECFVCTLQVSTDNYFLKSDFTVQ